MHRATCPHVSRSHRSLRLVRLRLRHVALVDIGRVQQHFRQLFHRLPVADPIIAPRRHRDRLSPGQTKGAGWAPFVDDGQPYLNARPSR